MATVEYRDAWRGLRLPVPEGWMVRRLGHGLQVQDATGARTLFVQACPGMTEVTALAQQLMGWLRSLDPRGEGWLLPADPACPARRTVRARLTPAGAEAVAGSFSVATDAQGGTIVGFLVPQATYEADSAVAAEALAGLAPCEAVRRRLWREPGEGAATAVVPEGWQAGGGVDRTRPGIPPIIFQAAPDPLTLVYATTDVRILAEHGMGMFMPGPFPLAPFTDAAGYAQAALLPSVQQQAPDAQILELVPRPDAVAQAVAMDAARTGQDPSYLLQACQPSAVDARLRYTMNGTPVQQVTRVHTARIPPALTMGQSTWIALLPFAYRAPAAQMPALEPVLEGVAQSFEAEPGWQARQQMAAQQYIQWSAMDRARRQQEISRTLSETSDIIMQGYQQRQESQDRIYHRWSNTTLGRTDLLAPDGTVYNVPDLYARQYWRAPDGTIIGAGALFTPDPTWQPLTEA